MRPLVGIFIGGAGRRMGGVAKGLLLVDGEPLVERTLRIARAVGDVVLVGDARAYPALAPSIADDPPGVGPLGGLGALLVHAGERDAIALACDMPHVAESDLLALAEASFEGDILAGRRPTPASPQGALPKDAPWEPLFARYRSPRVLPLVRQAIDEGIRSFQRLFERLVVIPFLPRDPATLVDWDEPADLRE